MTIFTEIIPSSLYFLFCWIGKLTLIQFEEKATNERIHQIFFEAMDSDVEFLRDML